MATSRRAPDDERDGTGVLVRDLAADDLERVAAVHRAAFPRSALTRLGAEAVRRYYAWQLDGPHDAVALGAFVGGRLAGFCFAGVFRGAISGFVRRERRFLALRLVLRPTALADPLFRSRLVRGVSMARRGASSRRDAGEAPARRARPFGVLAIATDPGAQGRGVGAALMAAAEAAALRRGFARMRLTVSPDNAKAIRFYERLGWLRDGEPGPWDGGMEKSLGERTDARQGS